MSCFGESWSAQSVSSTVAGSHVPIVSVRSEHLFYCCLLERGVGDVVNGGYACQSQ